ncbi:MAG: glycosyl hydrolase family 17 protein [Bacteroidota bacterium]
MKSAKKVTAQTLLSDPATVAISYGGYRANTREVQPSIKELKEDLKLLSAIGIKMLRTYNVQLPHATNVVKAISELKAEDPSFEMYVMLGAWIDCKNAWTDKPVDHDVESEQNREEIARAVALAQQYPDIIKVIAVGNEAMVKWATAYYVQPGIILKWVKHLQELKKNRELPSELWITSSDNFASWGGGTSEYHVDDLDQLIREVDYLSIHTYPMHDTHYNPVFWGIPPQEEQLSKQEKIEQAMNRSVKYAQSQYNSVKSYMKQIGVKKPIHIGETGWSSYSNELYGSTDSKAVDEYKAALFHEKLREWTVADSIACFYFEAFDESWKDGNNPGGSENHFGLFTKEGNAKYALWKLVDQGAFNGLGRNGKPVGKTYNGDIKALMADVLLPPSKPQVTSHYNPNPTPDAVP